MQLRIFAFFVLIMTCFSVQGQTTEEPPYLYYYSQMLGGLIIERADGTDSRLIAADLFPAGFPPGEEGIAGPGWSPSGRYFAGYTITTTLSAHLRGRPVIIDAITDEEVAPWLQLVQSARYMQWSPDGDDILLILANYRDVRSPDVGSFFWLFDVSTNKLLVDFGANLGSFEIDVSRIAWDTANEQISFYFAPNTYDFNRHYRVTMHFDGTTTREIITAEEFDEQFEPIDNIYTPNYLVDAMTVSPSGRYVAEGAYNTTLTDTQTGETIDLPRHSQATACATFFWSEDEQYILSAEGTIIAGGSCGGSVLSVTDSKGELWRELGGCSWHFPACAGWLPDHVDVDALPPGSVQPIQLDAIRTEFEDQTVSGSAILDLPDWRLHCRDSEGVFITLGDEVLYDLSSTPCPWIMVNNPTIEGRSIVLAYNPDRSLLAIYEDFGALGMGVTIWQRRDDSTYEQILRLNASGYELAFTEDGNFLRARNVNGWQIYAVEDILAYADNS